MGACLATPAPPPKSKIFGLPLYGIIPDPVTRCLRRIEAAQPSQLAEAFAPGAEMSGNMTFVQDLEEGLMVQKFFEYSERIGS
jgi:hypothetical protein